MSKWKDVTLGDLIALDVNAVKVEPAHTYDIVGVLNRGRGLLYRGPLTGFDTAYKTLNLIGPNQIIYSRLKAFEGAITVVPNGVHKVYASQEFPTFTCGPKLLPGFFRLLTTTQHLWDTLQNLSTGMGGRRERVKPNDFLTIKIALPSPLEQRRIVELVGAVDAQIDALTDEIATLNSLWRAGVADLDACDASVELGDAVDRIEAGKSPAGFDREPEPGERAVLKISAVGRGYFDPTSVKTVAANVDLPPASQVRKGDVLLVRCNGVLERVGDVCQVRDDPGPLFLCDKTLRLVPRTDIVSAEYLAHAMTSPRVKDQIAERTTGSDMRNIGQRALRELRIPVLPTNLQAVVGAALTAYLVESTALSNELADLRAFRAAFLAALLNQDVEIPESYDDLLAEVS